MRIYEFLTQWITLGTLFLLVDLYTEWLPVVTLGGLVVGSFIIGLGATLLDRLGNYLAQALGAVHEPQTLYYKRGRGLWPELLHKALVLVGVLLGVYGLAMLLPGYTIEVTGELVTFLIIFAFATMYLGNILRCYPQPERR